MFISDKNDKSLPLVAVIEQFYSPNEGLATESSSLISDLLTRESMKILIFKCSNFLISKIRIA